MLYFAIPIALLCLSASGMALLFKTRIGFVFPFDLLALTTIMYLLTAITNSLRVALAACIGIGAIILIAAYSLKRIKLANIKRYCATPGLLAFIVFGITAYGVASIHGADPIYWDEFAHWGQMTKELIRLDHFYLTNDTTLLYHNDYPPAAPLLEATFCMLSHGAFHAKTMYAALWLTQLSVFCPIVEICSSKPKQFKVLLGSVATLAVLACTIIAFPCFDGGVQAFWKSIYPDTIMALAGGLGLYVAFQYQYNLKYALALTTTLSFLILLKQAALFFVAVTAIVLTIRTIKHIKEQKEARTKTHASVLFAICPFGAIACIYYSWKTLVTLSPLPSAHGQFALDFSLLLQQATNINDLFAGLTSPFAQSYANALLFYPLWSNSPISISYFGFFAIIAITTALLGTLFNKRLSTTIALLVLEGLTVCAYALFMAFMYCFAFSTSDSSSLVCFERYLGVCPVALAFISLWYICDHNMKTSSANRATIIALTAVCIIAALSFPGFHSALWAGKSSVSETKADATFLTANLNDPTQSVLYINEGEHPFQTLQLAYYANGVRISRSVENGGYTLDGYTWILDNDEMLALLQTNNYLFVKNASDAFRSNYQCLFDSPIEAGTLYRLTPLSNTVGLTKIAQE